MTGQASSNGPIKSRLDRLSVGVKLTATLIMVVIVTTTVLVFIQDALTSSYLRKHAQLHMQELSVTSSRLLDSRMADVGDAQKALDTVFEQLKDIYGPGQALYLVDFQGRVLLPKNMPEVRLPAPAVLRQLPAAEHGIVKLQIGGEATWLAHQRLASSPLAVVTQADLPSILGAEVSSLNTWLLAAALFLCAGVGLFAVWLGQRELIQPLKRLTTEAERVAGGDLTPPQVDEGRDDEVGRLSRSLHDMTLAAREMVEQAQASRSRFRHIFSENRDAIIIIDEEGRVEAANPAAAQMFGFPDTEAMQQLSSTEELYARPAEREYYLEVLDEQGFVKDYPATLQRTDGSTFDALITATRSGVRASFAMVRDVTQTLAAQRALLESEERYRRLLENAPDIIFRWNIQQGGFEYLSPAVEVITGYLPHEIMADPDLLWRAMHPRGRDQMAEAWQAFNRGEGPSLYEQEFQFIHRAGQSRWIKMRSMLVRDRRGQTLAVEGLATDITQSKQLEQALRQGQAMVESILAGLPVAVMVVDRDHRVVHWNRAMERLSGLPAEEVVGTRKQWHPFYTEPRPVLADLMLDKDWEQIQSLYQEKALKPSTLIGGGLECEDYYPHLGDGGRHIYFLAAPVMNEDGEVERVVETLVDISDHRALEEELRRLSVTDDLTGLYNQRFFYATLGREVQSARRYGHPLCLLLMDLDRFKSYNDTWGHLEGDQVLAATAKTLGATVRATDLPCRYGGEEYVVLLPHTGLEEALQVAERVRLAVAALSFHPQAGDQPVEARVTVSIGAAQLGADDDNQDLVRHADQAMYAAKEAGRHRLAVWMENRETVLKQGSHELPSAPSGGVLAAEHGGHIKLHQE